MTEKYTPSFGVVPVRAFKRAAKTPGAGMAGDIFREFDPLWGASEEEIADAEAIMDEEEYE